MRSFRLPIAKRIVLPAARYSPGMFLRSSCLPLRELQFDRTRPGLFVVRNGQSGDGDSRAPYNLNSRRKVKTVC